jgi:hypothetical protein
VSEVQGKKSQTANIFISDDYLQEELIGPAGGIERVQKASFLMRCCAAQRLTDLTDDYPVIGNDKRMAFAKKLNLSR